MCRITLTQTDISTIPLWQLRSAICMIAQDPVLLSGTLRLNLDLEGHCTDDQLYDALHQVQLITVHDDPQNSIKPKTSDISEVSGIDQKHRNIFQNLESEIKPGGDKSVLKS